jgi:hypothetical protein
MVPYPIRGTIGPFRPSWRVGTEDIVNVQVDGCSKGGERLVLGPLASLSSRAERCTSKSRLQCDDLNRREYEVVGRDYTYRRRIGYGEFREEEILPF